MIVAHTSIANGQKLIQPLSVKVKHSLKGITRIPSIQAKYERKFVSCILSVLCVLYTTIFGWQIYFIIDCLQILVISFIKVAPFRAKPMDIGGKALQLAGAVVLV